MNNETLHPVNAGDTGPARWWQQVLALGCLPEAQAQTQAPPGAAAPAAFRVRPKRPARRADRRAGADLDRSPINSAPRHRARRSSNGPRPWQTPNRPGIKYQTFIRFPDSGVRRNGGIRIFIEDFSNWPEGQATGVSLCSPWRFVRLMRRRLRGSAVLPGNPVRRWCSVAVAAGALFGCHCTSRRSYATCSGAV